MQKCTGTYKDWFKTNKCYLFTILLYLIFFVMSRNVLLWIVFFSEHRHGDCPCARQFTLARKKTVRGRKFLSYGVPFEKFSWCLKSEDFRININADLHGCPMSLRLLMLLVFLYSSDLHLELTNPTYFIVLRASAVSHTTELQLSQAQVTALFAPAKQP